MNAIAVSRDLNTVAGIRDRELCWHNFATSQTDCDNVVNSGSALCLDFLADNMEVVIGMSNKLILYVSMSTAGSQLMSYHQLSNNLISIRYHAARNTIHGLLASGRIVIIG